MGWGFVGDFVKGAVSAVSKVAEVATGGAVGKMIAGALERFGLPKEICGVIACIGDPSYTTKFLCEEIDRVGSALGLPKELTGALKKVVENAEKYTQAFVKGGFGAVVCEVGKDLGLPPELYLAVAAGVDAWSGNAPGAAANLMQLAGKCAKHLGVPASAVSIVEFAGAAYARDVKGMAKAGLGVIDSVDILPPEVETFAHLALAGANNDQKAVQENFIKFATQVGEKVGLPPEAMGLLKLGIAYETGDSKGMEAALKEIGNDVIGRLPAEYQGPLRPLAQGFAKHLSVQEIVKQSAKEQLEMRLSELTPEHRKSYDETIQAGIDKAKRQTVRDVVLHHLPHVRA